MLIDGKKIAQDILAKVKAEVSLMDNLPRLVVFTCAPNFETKKFLTLKQKRAEEVGINIEVVSLQENSTTGEVVEKIKNSIPANDGIIVQLPFPSSIDIQVVLQSIPMNYDVDAIFYDGVTHLVLPPVVGAIDEIARRENISWANKKVVVVGQGRLVGKPATIYAKNNGAEVIVIEKDTDDAYRKIAQADILILGAGVPGLIKSAMVKEGVIIFDASTSEDGGLIVGDADPDVEEKALFLTPVPGGIGPITIAVLLRNLVLLSKLT